MKQGNRKGMMTRPSGKSNFDFRQHRLPHVHSLELRDVAQHYGADGYECDYLTHAGGNSSLRGPVWHCKGCGHFDVCPACYPAFAHAPHC